MACTDQMIWTVEFGVPVLVFLDFVRLINDNLDALENEEAKNTPLSLLPIIMGEKDPTLTWNHIFGDIGTRLLHPIAIASLM